MLILPVLLFLLFVKIYSRVLNLNFSSFTQISISQQFLIEFLFCKSHSRTKLVKGMEYPESGSLSYLTNFYLTSNSILPREPIFFTKKHQKINQMENIKLLDIYLQLH